MLRSRPSPLTAITLKKNLPYPLTSHLDCDYIVDIATAAEFNGRFQSLPRRQRLKGDKEEMNKIHYYTNKLARLEAKLVQFQKVGVSDRMIAIKLIWEIERIERILESLQSIKSVIKPFKRATRTLTLETPCRSYRAWVAKISPEKDPKYGGFKKQFIEPISREFGKKGETEATFEIPVDLTAIYQDSDGDYWIFQNFDGDIKTICYQEVCYRFQQKVA